MAGFSQSSVCNRFASSPAAEESLCPKSFEANFLTRIAMAGRSASINSGNGLDMGTVKPRVIETNTPDFINEVPATGSSTECSRLISHYKSSSPKYDSDSYFKKYAFASPKFDINHNCAQIYPRSDQFSNQATLNQISPFVPNEYYPKISDYQPQLSYTSVNESHLGEAAQVPRQKLSLGYRKSTCSSHKKFTVLYCEVCKITICRLCSIFAIGEHYDHQLSPKRHCDDARLDVLEFMNVIISDICDLLHNFGVKIPFVLSAIDGHLIFQVEFVSKIHFDGLYKLLVDANQLIRHVGNIVIDCHYVLKTLDSLKTLIAELETCDEPDDSPTLLPVARSSGGPSAKHCILKGQGLAEVVINRETCIYLLLKNDKGEICELKDTPIDINALLCNTNISKKVAVTVNSHELRGIVKISFKFPSIGLYNLSIRVNTEEIPHTPVKIYAKNSSKFSPCMSPMTLIGDKESFNKPYGAAVDKNGNLYVADRCNNCVKVLYQNLSFKMTIGESGTRTGQLRKPSGIAIDKDNNLVICDKDNHRLQIFSAEGEFLRCTSEGALSFPWCVAVNSTNQYVVTHSKNRICLLSSQLEVIRSISLTTESVSSFSLAAQTNCSRLLNPRGVCIGYMDEILVTDFESGSVYSVKPENGKCTKVAEAPTSKNVQRRLQGITLDSDGYLLVADSKNCAVNVFTYSGELVSTWQVAGKPVSIAEITKNRYLVTAEEGDSSFVFIYARNSKVQKVNQKVTKDKYAGSTRVNLVNRPATRKFR